MEALFHGKRKPQQNTINTTFKCWHYYLRLYFHEIQSKLKIKNGLRNLLSELFVTLLMLGPKD